MASAALAADHADAIRSGSRRHLSRVITWVESTRADHRALGAEVLTLLGPPAKPAVRVGISGVPGAGKSTFIDALGCTLVDAGHRVAVLAVDPSSTRSGGSVLGDRTRMAELVVRPEAYIRPSPTNGHLGGVARATREAMAVVEAAGFDVVLVETVGVGQSEVAVAGMVDTFVLLAVARTGDQLQGIKRGILELVDVVAVNKADGDHALEAKKASVELRGALRLLRSADRDAMPFVTTCSALTRVGLPEIWDHIVDRHAQRVATGELARSRARQQRDWLWAVVEAELLASLRAHSAVLALAPQVEAAVMGGSLSPSAGADRILAAFRA